MGVLHGTLEPVHVGWLYSELGTVKSVIKSHVLPGCARYGQASLYTTGSPHVFIFIGRLDIFVLR